MKTAFLSILLLFSTLAFAQYDSTTEIFLKEIITRKYDTSTIFYTDKMGEGTYDYIARKSLTKRVVKDIGGVTKDKLILTAEEIAYLKKQLTTAKNLSWPENLFINSKRISGDSTHSFLAQIPNRDLYLFSQPIFIRNKSIALFYVIHLCCGGIYGPVDLSFHRRTETAWKRWITIDGGAF